MQSVQRRTTSRLYMSFFSVLIAFLSQATIAQERAWYGGISGGELRADMEHESVITALRAKGYTTGEFSVDDKDMAAKVFGGYSFSRYLAVEGSYFDLGNVAFQASVMPSAVQEGKALINGFSLDLVGNFPLAEDYSAFARAGINNARIEQNFTTSSGAAPFTDTSDRGTNEKYGIGVEFALTTAITVRAELERYRISENLVTSDRVDTFMIGFIYRLDAR